MYKVGAKYYISNQTLASDSLYAKGFKYPSGAKIINPEEIFVKLNSETNPKNIENKGITLAYYNPEKPTRLV